MRLIDADALMQSLGITNMDCKKCAWYDKVWGRCERGGDFEDACCAIEDAPTIEERKKGKWIQPCDITGFGRCSNCNALWDNSLIENRFFRYCPRCGADMRGEEE